MFVFKPQVALLVNLVAPARVGRTPAWRRHSNAKANMRRAAGPDMGRLDNRPDPLSVEALT